MVVITARRRALALGVTLALMAGLAACTSDEPAAAPVRTTVEQIWTTAGLEPVSAVRNVGGVAVVYGTTPAGLVIDGLDPATGAQLWAKPAVLPIDDDDSWVIAIGDSVAYFRPTGVDRISTLVVADPHSGADLTVSAPRYWNYWPKVCSDDDAWVCAISSIQAPNGEWDRRPYRVNRSTGETQLDAHAEPADPGQAYSFGGTDLYWTAAANHSQVSREVDGAVLWAKPFSDLFGPSATSWMSYYHSESSDNTYSVMTLTGTAGSETGKPIDLATGVVSSAFDLATGSSRWIAEGTALGCLGGHPILNWNQDEGTDPPHAFRCRYTGTAAFSMSALTGSQLVTSGLGVTLERFDPASGVTQWTSPLGDARTLAADTSTGAAEALLDDSHLFVSNSAGGLIVDLNNGQSRASGSSDVLWCDDIRTYPRPEAYYSTDTKKVTTARRSGVFRPCTPDGTDAPLPTTAIPGAVSASFGNERRVMSLPDKVSGFLSPPVDGEQSATSSAPVSSTTAESSSAVAGSESSTTPIADSNPSGAATATPAAAPAIEKVWTSTGFEPLTAPKIVGNTAVLYATSGSDLYLTGLDPANGIMRWRQLAWAGGLEPQTNVSVTEVDGQLVYLRPTEALDEQSVVVIADPETGADQVVTEQRWWRGNPIQCSDDPAYLCGSAWSADASSVTATRVERSTGALTVSLADSSEPYEKLFGDLVSVKGAAVETVGIVKGGRLLWSAPVADLLGTGATLANGWIIGGRPGDPELVYISAPIGWQSDGSKYPPFDLGANQVTAAVNYQTGAVLWREPGTWANCRNLLGDIALLSTPGSSYPTLRCRYTGQLDSSPPGKGRELTAPTGLSVTLERVDLTTGKAIWSLPLGDQRSLAADAPGLTQVLLDDHQSLIAGQVIDLDTGTVRPPAADDVFWCPARQTFHQSVPLLIRNETRYDRAAGGEAYPCDARANPTTATPKAVPLAVGAATDDGVRLVSTPAGVVAYRVPA